MRSIEELILNLVTYCDIAFQRAAMFQKFDLIFLSISRVLGPKAIRTNITRISSLWVSSFLP